MEKIKFLSKLLKNIIRKINCCGFMNLREEYKLKPYVVIKEFYSYIEVFISRIEEIISNIRMNEHEKEEKNLNLGYC